MGPTLFISANYISSILCLQLAVIQLFAVKETFNFDLVDDEISGFQLLYLNKQDKRSETG